VLVTAGNQHFEEWVFYQVMVVACSRLEMMHFEVLRSRALIPHEVYIIGQLQHERRFAMLVVVVISMDHSVLPWKGSTEIVSLPYALRWIVV